MNNIICTESSIKCIKAKKKKLSYRIYFCPFFFKSSSNEMFFVVYILYTYHCCCVINPT